jgi:hypothetical protein
MRKMGEVHDKRLAPKCCTKTNAWSEGMDLGTRKAFGVTICTSSVWETEKQGGDEP